VSLPFKGESNSSVNLRKCEICELIVTSNDWKTMRREDIAKMKRECNKAANKDIYKNLENIGHEPIEDQSRIVDVCRDW
jgi:AAA+ ATPase superfamily predicted ATPase